MEKILERIDPKWIVAIVSLFIIGRAITAIASPEFAQEILSNGDQWKLEGLKFRYIGNTVLLPFLLAFLAVELANNQVSPTAFRAVLIVHLVSVVVAACLTAIDAISFRGNPMQGVPEGVTILNPTIFWRSVVALVLCTASCSIAYLWQKREFRFFIRKYDNA